MNEQNKSTLDLDENIASLLTYVLGFITGIIFIIIEKENKVVRFHAFQSLFTFGALFVLSVMVKFTIGLIPIIGWLISILFTFCILGVWVFLMYKAYKSEKFLVPIVGEIAEQQVAK